MLYDARRVSCSVNNVFFDSPLSRARQISSSPSGRGEVSFSCCLKRTSEEFAFANFASDFFAITPASLTLLDSRARHVNRYGFWRFNNNYQSTIASYLYSARKASAYHSIRLIDSCVDIEFQTVISGGKEISCCVILNFIRIFVPACFAARRR